jgi:RND family efflux transporter MFP subunit
MMVQTAGTQPGRQGRPGRRPVLVFFAVLALLVAAGIVVGLLPRLSRQKVMLAASETLAARRPVVIVSAARFAAGQEDIDLPGDLQAIVESPIFARADGYLKTRMVDIGDRVTKGQPMADLETPELDQQISQAHATLAQATSTIKELQADLALARANLGLAQVTRDRWQRLVAKGAVSKQESDEKQADFEVKEAQTQKADATLATVQDTIHAAEANLRRLEEMKGFARVTAPFDGVVTARNVDVGTLINAGNGGAAREMFRVAQIQPLRVFVNVPQTYVEQVRAGQTAELRVQEKPGQVFPAKVTNIAQSLDSNSRAMLVILETPNPGAALFPGMYAQVRFRSPRTRRALRVPGDTVVMGKTGARVAVVGADHVVHFRNVSLGQDLGSEIEVTAGIAEGEMLISNPSDVVQEGVVVEVRGK